MTPAARDAVGIRAHPPCGGFFVARRECALRSEMKMTNVWTLAALWFGLALFASLCSIYLRLSTALVEIIVGTGAGWIIASLIGGSPCAPAPPVKFLPPAGRVDHRLAHRRLARRRRALDQVPRRRRRDHAYLSRRYRARPGRVPAEMER